MSNEGRRMVEVKVPARQPGAYIFNGKLFFKLLGGDAVVCECIGEPWASEIVRLFNEGVPPKYEAPTSGETE